MRGLITSMIILFMFTAMMIISIPLTLLFAKVHLYGIVEDYVDVNKAKLAVISLLSKTKDGKSYADLMVEKIINNESFDELKFSKLLEGMGFECYTLYIEEDKIIITEKKCKDARLVKARIRLPLPELEYRTLVLEVGV